MKRLDFATIIILLAIFLVHNCHGQGLSISDSNSSATESYYTFYKTSSLYESNSYGRNLSKKDGIYFLESTGGLIFGAAGSIPTLFVSFFTLLATAYECPDYTAIGAGLCIATSVIIPFGSTIGTNIAGGLMHQNGSFKNSFDGSLKTGFAAWGISSAILTTFFLCNNPQAGLYAPAAAIALSSPVMAVASIIGSVKGYNKRGDYEEEK